MFVSIALHHELPWPVLSGLCGPRALQTLLFIPAEIGLCGKEEGGRRIEFGTA